MPKKTYRFGGYATLVSVLWLLWVVVFLPSQAISGHEQCRDLQELAGTHKSTFDEQCVRMMREVSDSVAPKLLIVSCVALAILSLGLWIQERRYEARLKTIS